MEISTLQDLNKEYLNNFQKMFAILFYSNENQASLDYRKSFIVLQEIYPDVAFLTININQYEICKKFEVQQVSTFITTYGSKTFIQKLKAQSLYSIQSCLQQSIEIYNQNFRMQKAAMNNKFNQILQNSTQEILIFIKGTAFEPRCKFTRELVEILQTLKLKFDYVDILEQGEFKEWIKVFSGWKTFPQVFVNKKIIGGLVNDSIILYDFFFQDTVKSMIQSQEFQKLLKPEDFMTNEQSLSQILERYSNEVLVFLNCSNIDDSLSTLEQNVLQLFKQINVRYNFINLKNQEQFTKFLFEKFAQNQLPLVFIQQEFVCIDQLSEANCVQKIPLQAFRAPNLEKIKLLISKIPLIGFIANDEKFSVACDQLVNFLLLNALNSKTINVDNEEQTSPDQQNLNDALKQYLSIPEIKFPAIFFKGELLDKGLDALCKLKEDKTLDFLK